MWNKFRIYYPKIFKTVYALKYKKLCFYTTTKVEFIPVF